VCTLWQLFLLHTITEISFINLFFNKWTPVQWTNGISMGYKEQLRRLLQLIIVLKIIKAKSKKDKEEK
jgi:hypothetical protein